MHTWNETKHLSDRPKIAHLRYAERLQSLSLVGVAVVTGVVLTGWLIPGFGAILPDGWTLMKANTALGLLLCAFGVTLAQRPQTQTAKVITMTSCVTASVLASSALFGYATAQPVWLDSWLAPDAASPIPGRMPISTAMYLLPTALAIATWSSKIRGKLPVADVFATLMLAQALIIVGAYLYGAWTLVVTGEAILTSPQALVSIVMMTAAVMISHLRNGVYALVIGTGIGSSFLRIGLPSMFIIPFLIVMLAMEAVDRGHLDIRLAAALTAALASLVTLLFSLVVAKKLNRLEAELRSLSLTDPMTSLHNRRGFEALGEQRFHEAQRNGDRVALLYFDLDGLKHVNDCHGHDVGSSLIQDFANLLHNNFRHSDVLGRLGGDEFAVLLHDGDDADACLRRLEEAAVIADAKSSQPYSIRYSVGVEYASPAEGDTLADLVNRADESMYHHKRAKRRAAGQLEEAPAVC